jgi:hypothetical protein
MARTRLSIYCFVLLSAFMPIGCSQDAVNMAAPTSKPATEWIHLYPRPAFEGTPLDQSRWRVVPRTKQASAESMLQAVSNVSITDAQARDLTNPIGLAPRVKRSPYLLRAVGALAGTNGFEVEVNSNGDVWVACGALSHHAVAIERRAIVAWLERPPKEVFVSFSVAE